MCIWSCNFACACYWAKNVSVLCFDLKRLRPSHRYLHTCMQPQSQLQAVADPEFIKGGADFFFLSLFFSSSPSSSFLLKNGGRLKRGSMFFFLGLGAPAPLDRPPSAAPAPGYRLPAMSGRSVLCLVHGRVIVDSCTLTGRLKKV